ncbi:MAG: transcription antitermination factor NusB, partial [Micrococcales bacterium]|nr:transcription antitermination factor NusB [Micrococcales bacterium]
MTQERDGRPGRDARSERSDRPDRPTQGEGGRSRADRRDFRASGPHHRSAAAPSTRARRVDRPRRVAYDVMRAIAGGAYANLELAKQLRGAGLRGRDAAFVTELVYGASRLRGRYDPIVARGAGRELADIDPDVLDLLRLGAHQLLGMRVDAYAAVDASVALAREVLGAGRAGFVNAVLRRVSEKDEAAWLRILTKNLEPGSTQELAISQSHPEWVVRALQGALVGSDDDPAAARQIEALLQADNEPAAVSLVARPGLSTVAELIESGAEASATSSIGAVLRSGGDPGDIAAIRQGRAAVQDEGSQVVTLAALAAVADLGSTDRGTGAGAGDGTHGDGTHEEVNSGSDGGQRWLDLCAGPGGKAALLASASIERGATLFANDSSERRTRLVNQTLGAAIDAGAEVYVGTGDGREIGAQEPESFDFVLLDAPCTGLGALRRRPEARWRRQPQDVAALSH